MASMDLVFRFLGVDAGAGREFDRLAGKASSGHAALAKFALGAAAAGATVAAVSVDMAMKYQSAMELIRTQAGGTQAEVERMSKALLALAGQVGTAPTELSKGLYHLESNGLRGAKALDALKYAAEGAKIGQANLEDVTNALGAVIASGIKGSKDYASAMSVLNNTVGIGDMRMQDLAEALGTGVLAVVKGFGVTLRDTSAALAVFGDNNIRGADAGTQLRMAVLNLAVGTPKAGKVLASIGTSSKQLRDDLASGGLNKALTDLHKHLIDSGDTGSRMGDVLLQAFGKKAGTGLSILEGQFGRWHKKFSEANKADAKGFASSWAAYNQTFGASLDKAKASLQSLVISLGTVLLPYVKQLTDYFTKHVVPMLQNRVLPDIKNVIGFVKNNSDWLKPLAVGVAGLAVAYKALKLASNVGGTLKGVGLLGRGAGGLGGIASMAKPIPVYVTNPGFGGGGGLSTVEKDAAKGGLLAKAASVAKSLGPAAASRALGTSVARTLPLYAVGAQRDSMSTPHDPMIEAVFRFIAQQTGQPLNTGSAMQRGAFADMSKFGIKFAAGTGFTGDPKKIAEWAAKWREAAKEIGAANTQIATNAPLAKTAAAAQAQLAGSLHNVVTTLHGLVSGAYLEAQQLGTNILDGMIAGMKAATPSAMVQAKITTGAIMKQIRLTGGISSPSKVTKQYGIWLAEGLSDGMAYAIKKVQGSAKKLVDTVTNALQGLQQSRDTLYGQITGNLMAPSSLGNLFSQTDTLGSPMSPSIGGIMSLLGMNNKALLRERKDLRILRRRHVPAELLNQIASMDPAQGVQIADLLAHASRRQLHRIESAEKQNISLAHQIGKGVADAMYGKAIRIDKRDLNYLAGKIKGGGNVTLNRHHLDKRNGHVVLAH